MCLGLQFRVYSVEVGVQGLRLRVECLRVWCTETANPKCPYTSNILNLTYGLPEALTPMFVNFFRLGIRAKRNLGLLGDECIDVFESLGFWL